MHRLMLMAGRRAVAPAAGYDNLANWPSEENRASFDDGTDTLSWFGPLGGGPSTANDVEQSVVLTPSAGFTNTDDDVIIEGLDITGIVVINGDNVTLRYCRINGGGFDAIRVNGIGFVAYDNLIDGIGFDNQTAFSGAGTLYRNHVINCENGFYLESNSIAEENYVHDYNFAGGAHPDGFVVEGGPRDNIRIAHNRIDNAGIQTSAVYISNFNNAVVTDIEVDGNLSTGGTNAIYVDGEQAAGGSIDGVSITDNFLGEGFFGGFFFIRSATNTHGSGNVEYPSLDPLDDF